MKNVNRYVVLLFFLAVATLPVAALQTTTPEPLRPPNPVCDLAFSPDARLIAAASDAGNVALWATDTGTLLHEFDSKNNCPHLIFSTDGETLFALYPGVIGGEYAETILWDTQTGAELRRFTGRGILSDDQQLLLTTGPDAPDRLWDITAGQELSHFDSPLHIGIGGVISPDNTRVLAYNWPQRFPELWDMTSGELLFSFPEGDSWVGGLQFLPDNHHALVVYAPDGLALWNLDTLTQEQVFPDAAFGSALRLSAAGQPVLSGYRAGFFRTWDVLTGELLQETTLTSPLPEADMVGSQFSHDGRSFLVVLQGGIVQVWDVATGALRYQLTSSADSLVDWDATATQVVFSPDDRSILVGYSNEALHLLDAETGTEIRNFLLPSGR
ncbi:MAG: PQQ-binding-like beta-propeller repeat protein [Anaerolineaceae bacterium]|nr:PQQ-binding-like beta-propeller repeat protein [Anaerolineaceae bacterium]